MGHDALLLRGIQNLFRTWPLLVEKGSRPGRSRLWLFPRLSNQRCRFGQHYAQFAKLTMDPGRQRPGLVQETNCYTAGRGLITLSMAINSSLTFTGFDTKASMPALRHRSLSPCIALAVMAMIGRWAPV
jgi:hypothetical protein